MSALFACTRCAKRFPFEDLSENEQLCQDCRSNFPVVKCTYCRTEFQQNDKNTVSPICKKCAHNVKAYGKPRACEYCNVIAAFIGKRCQRCANSEKKWGRPKQCDQCKQQCAFDRGDDSRKKVDGKLLCWLCTMAYKRVLAKHLKNRENVKRALGKDKPSPVPIAEEMDLPYSPSMAFSGSADNSQDGATPYSPGALMIGDDKLSPDTPSDRLTPGGGSRSKDNTDWIGMFGKRKPAETDRLTSDAKKLKTDKGSNGVSQISISRSSSTAEFGGQAENIVQMTQLREKVESLKKQLLQKDQQLLERDKKITELKAHNFEAEAKMRQKIQQMQKEHRESMDQVQGKMRDLQRQITLANKKKSD